ncbi:thiamine phosphate synthase [Chondromyces crocatus]|uniref:Thiamine-phosphate synthase n=1 Tax=Chondromyces crocatus TaxID=52 RepID=A0A0K1EEI4_CHOCO|nr:thiamine phosphate synthase [Chondromyces crocatus]AKT39281.1 thiamine-phosphate diphosphorylase [Chondromyces crocatus]
MRGLYAIIDTDALARRGIDPIPYAEAVLAAKPGAIQLRDKRGSARRMLELLRALVPRAAAAGVPLFANDRPDLALLAGCEGIHVGQDDLPVTEVRALAERARVRVRIGLSTHDLDQLEPALREPIDYVAIGPIFPTANKEQADPAIGLPALTALVARVAEVRPGLPVVAIGGITLETAPQIGVLGACAAVIGALLPSEPEDGTPFDLTSPEALAAVTARATTLHRALLGAATPA